MGLLEIKAFIKSVSDMQYADAILVSWVDNRTSDCCSWERIKCNATTGWVMELSLSDAIRVNSNDVSDGFPIINMSLFVPFQELHVLDLWNNRFEGWEENKGKIYERSLHPLFGLNADLSSVGVLRILILMCIRFCVYGRYFISYIFLGEIILYFPYLTMFGTTFQVELI